jgi:hypothetical protein
MTDQLSSSKRLTMSKGVIIHLDSNEAILESSRKYFDQCPLSEDLTLETCRTNDEFSKKIAEHHENLKSLIFDLMGEEPGTEDFRSGNAKFLEDIKNSFADHNLPIFIYSGYPYNIPSGLLNCGTVFVMDKGKVGINVIFA